MSRKRSVRKPENRTTNPVYWIFCEGESEKAYAKYLKGKYRATLVEFKYIVRNSVDVKKIKSKTSDKNFDKKKDKIFLMYDLGVGSTSQNPSQKLQEIKKAADPHVELLVSNPCFELWYLLHFEDQRAHIDCKNCENRLKKHLPNYKKAEVPKGLRDGQCTAIERAEKLEEYKNPSTSVYVIFGFLKE